MKREHLYRGKRTDNGEWVEGNLVTVSGKSYIFPKNFLFSMMFSYHSDYEVIPETVGQFTGLIDKNGVKVFEGDVFSLQLSDGCKLLKVVKYIPEKCGFCVANVKNLPDESWSDIWSSFYQEWFDKVAYKYVHFGNIHNNPELMEVTP
jgi:uncharacterized phage protein (TIGR01671 family)